MASIPLPSARTVLWVFGLLAVYAVSMAVLVVYLG